MAKVSRTLVLPVTPLEAIGLLESALRWAELVPFAQIGPSLKARESFGFFKAGWPVTVTATVHPEPRLGSGVGATITMEGENFGFALNRVHAERKLQEIAEALDRLATERAP